MAHPRVAGLPEIVRAQYRRVLSRGRDEVTDSDDSGAAPLDTIV